MTKKIIGSYMDLDCKQFWAILENFRNAMALCKAQSPQDSDIQNIYVRDWALENEDGRRCVQVFLEKMIDGKELPIDLNDCIKVHKWFLNNGNFDTFEDGVDIEMGSCGSKPRLREIYHFNNYLEHFIEFIFWKDFSSPNTPTPPLENGLYLLKGVEANTGLLSITPSEGGTLYQIDHTQVVSACVNIPTPLSHSKKTNKHSAKPGSKKGKGQASVTHM